ncbi:kinesin-related protein 10-like [Nymphalis io]|uniref:kinesin-related protein 10-like n=1 Tax=Inachis io TaxID=171585 RepID=UPI00216AA64D|nr:kinesin-related protein 10-like [Nymphalis io]
MSNVKLAIRVRPFTEKELKSDNYCEPVVTVLDENTITITNIKVNTSGAGDSRKRVRRYYVDYAFNSACATTDSDYASQEKIFDTVGRQVLSTISRGQSACVLTYGQSATGKTHTMVGSAVQPGLIPRICKALAEELPLNITVSFLEIYNERVHDLLAGEAPLSLNSLPRRKGNARKDLRVREHPIKGPYVQNLRRVTVHDVETLLAVVNEGTRRRRTAATKRNICSSRSHALLELVTPKATLHLADLAGSEKAVWEGCARGRQKEGANINKSLVALSNVISALVSGGSGRGRFVPYRDSALTWLLKDCFTGGGSTFIIATVSPSVSCYGESASTLRWAARARHLPDSQGSTVANVTSKAALQSQFNHLLAELNRHFIQYKLETRQLLYDEKHWKLNDNQSNDTSKTEAKIGNIMNLRYVKGEGRNSESTPSSIASGSSDVISNMDKNAEISNEVNKEIDKLFGPALERTRSGSDIEVVPPLRHKKRHFRSQEVLFSDKALQSNQTHRLSDANLSEAQGNDLRNLDNSKIPQVSILYDNQRAEIIASVTERLYTKLKKNEAAISKQETKVDKKPVSETKVLQPLNELKICSNARQRLMELSKKALKNKRKIGIPAHTQTRKTVIRVKDQGIDVQTDLQSYICHRDRNCIFHRDVSTETTPMTPRLKEIAVGPKYSNLSYKDSSTLTDTKEVIYRNSCTMTELVLRRNHSSQTNVQPPPRRKKRQSAYMKYIKKIERIKSSTNDSSVSPVININISPMYADSDSQSSDETSDNSLDFGREKGKQSVTTTPDLLTNHSNLLKKTEVMTISDTNSPENCDLNNVNSTTPLELKEKILEDFSDKDNVPLPRVTVDYDRKLGQKEYEDLILGRNENIYPYSIKVAPVRKKDKTKTVIRFKDIDITPAECCSNEWQRKDNVTSNSSQNESEKETEGDNSVTSVLSEMDSDSFLWNKIDSANGDNASHCPKENQYENIAKLETSGCRSWNASDLRIQKESLCPDSQCDDEYYSTKRENKRIMNVKQRHILKIKNKSEHSTFDNIERKIKSACNSLEASVHKYDNYLLEFRDKTKNYCKTEAHARTPKEYLQHLIKLRKEAVQSNCHN